MDLQINMECRQCGLHFSDLLREMPHGMALRCPFCRGLEINLGEGALVEEYASSERFEPSCEERSIGKKAKL